MYIKEIKLNGFKSFADKTTISLDESFTGIVGPNGSGKSNIVDAVKWVLGEQSVKSLRGSDNMRDIIFNGSNTRVPSNMASVSITFDNTDRLLNIDYNEVSIKRVVYKTGENEYYINSDKCRLKDVTNLLLDSRSSKESFNIIPQNKIDQILSEKPEERRIIFEDAAGVLKYKKRKEESLLKLSRTHENVERINLIIDEASKNLPELEKSSLKAKEYKESLSELENVEIALIAKDISDSSEKLIENKKRKEDLESELSLSSTTSNTNSVEVEKIKVEVLNVDEDIKNISNEIFRVNESLITLSNKKTLLTERNKYDKESNDVKNNLVSLRDNQGYIKNKVSSINIELDNLKLESNSLDEKLKRFNNELNNVNSKRTDTYNNLNKYKSNYENIKNRITILEDNINSMSKIPYAVKSIINNPTLRGIHNVLGSLINTKSEYATMLDISLGSSSSNIVTEDESCAKEAIEYLKSHNAGRASFFPLNVIKPRSVDPDTMRVIVNMNGFVDVASSLVTYDQKYYNIVMNQLGNIIVSDNLNNAISISKKINHKYRVVSLSGDIIHVGGMMSGGSIKSNSSFISDKYELDRLKINIESINNQIKEYNESLSLIDNESNKIKENIYSINIDIIKNNESILNKSSLLEEKNKELDSINDEINNLTLKSLDKELEEVIKEYYMHEEKKLSLENKLEVLNKKKNELNSDLDSFERNIKLSNQKNNKLVSEINNIDILITKLNINLDNLLNRLSEDYSLGYEKAKSEYVLTIDEDEAREKVTNLRRKIKSLGDVSLSSIEEYERVSTRVNFLNKQKDDLILSENDLMKIINEMDEKMKSKFSSSFENINIEFNKVFKSLFKGGEAHLELTDRENILTSGIDIIAIPPGKNLKPLSLLSGGEKTLTAISLLFAIMNLEHVPFVILDEVESALDENNATIFGEYLNNYKNKTQLLVITHKKKTMEFLDKLYGITMQESGISKLVSVKLND